MDATRLPRILLMAEALPSRDNLTDQVSTPAPNGPPSSSESARSGADHAPSQDNNPILNTVPEEHAPTRSYPSNAREWIQRSESIDPPTTDKKMLPIIQSLELKWEIAGAKRTCMIAKMKIISKNDICLSVAQNHSAAYTRKNP